MVVGPDPLVLKSFNYHKSYLPLSTIECRMEVFNLYGKIISKEQLPIGGLSVQAFDEDPVLNPEDLLGSSVSDQDGLFSIQFDKSKFDDLLEAFDRTPDVFLRIKETNNTQLIKTRVTKTKKEIQYHIRTDPSTPNSMAPDPYSGNARRMLNMLAEVGDLLGIEYRFNLDLLNKGDLPEEVKKKISEFVDGYQDRRYNLDQLIVILSSLVDSLAEETRVGRIGYDGPQVPRLPRRTPYDQVIIWPKQEKFKWE